MANPVPTALRLRALADGLDHVEGVCWDPVRRCIWAGGEAGQLYRVEPDGATSIVTTIEHGALLGIALDGIGRLYVCDYANHQVWRVLEGGAYERFGEPIDYPNYATFSADGRLYVSDSGSFDEPNGSLFVIDADGTTTRLDVRPIAYPNGLCIDGGRLFVIESAAPGVLVFDPRDGSLEAVIAMDRCNPDGLALDAEGGLLVSCYQPNQLWRWTAKEGLVLVLEDWTGEYVLSPTNVCFYGEGLRGLALASLCGTRINSIRPPAAGAGLCYPEFGGARS